MDGRDARLSIACVNSSEKSLPQEYTEGQDFRMPLRANAGILLRREPVFYREGRKEIREVRKEKLKTEKKRP
jgi:hypothetical protein